jgi:hypothetical protein
MNTQSAIAEHLYRNFRDPLDLDWEELPRSRRDIWGRRAGAVLQILADQGGDITRFTWIPTPTWRAVGPEGDVWCESSNESEVRELARPNDRLEQLWSGVATEWRTEDGAHDQTDHLWSPERTI